MTISNDTMAFNSIPVTTNEVEYGILLQKEFCLDKLEAGNVRYII